MTFKKLGLMSLALVMSCSLFAAPHHGRRIKRARHTAVVQTAGRVDVNSATLQQLQSVKGLGPKKAAAIVAYRNANGPFKSLNDLMKVKGMGPKRLAKIVSSLSI